MKTVIVYYSFTGVTRTIAEHVRSACGCDLVEVRARQPYSKLSAYTRGTFRARGDKADPVEPDPIDVSAYDLIVLGTPVWGGRPTPVMNGAVAALAGVAGKEIVVFATCGAQPGEALQRLRAVLTAKGARVAGEFAFSTKDLQDPANVEALIARVSGAGAPPVAGG